MSAKKQSTKAATGNGGHLLEALNELLAKIEKHKSKMPKAVVEAAQNLRDELGDLSDESAKPLGETLAAGLRTIRKQQGRHDRYQPSGTELIEIDGRSRLVRTGVAKGAPHEQDVVLSLKTERAGRTIEALSLVLYRSEAAEKFAAAYQALTGTHPRAPWWIDPLVGMLDQNTLRQHAERLTGKAAAADDEPSTAAAMLAELDRVRRDSGRIGIVLEPPPLTTGIIEGMIDQVGGRGGRKAGTVVAAWLGQAKKRPRKL